MIRKHTPAILRGVFFKYGTLEFRKLPLKSDKSTIFLILSYQSANSVPISEGGLNVHVINYG